MNYKDKVSELKTKRKIYAEKAEALESKIETEKIKLESTELLQAIVQDVAKKTQENIIFHIRDIVQLAVDSCFPGEFNFCFDFEIKRGKTEVFFALEKDGEKIDIMDSTGGGVVDIVSFALRIACWSIGKTDNCIILDEPFRFLSKDLQSTAGKMLKDLSEKLDLQIMMVTHSEELIDSSDRVFHVQNRKGVSEILKTC